MLYYTVVLGILLLDCLIEGNPSDNVGNVSTVKPSSNVSENTSTKKKKVYSKGLGQKSQKEFVEYLRSNGFISSNKVAEVMTSIDRKFYIDYLPYDDLAKMTYYGEMDAQPHNHGIALETLKDHLKEGNRALEVGCGTGYLTACMAVMVGRTGRVVGVEQRKKQVNLANKCVANDTFLQSQNVQIKFLAGQLKDVVPAEGPFDAIHVAPAERVKVPDVLLQQLKNGGRMLIAIGPIGRLDAFTVIDKSDNGSIISSNITGKFYFNRSLW